MRVEITEAALCVVRVNHIDLLLPMGRAMELIAIVQQAVRVERDWAECSVVYSRLDDDDGIDAELTLVRANQVRRRPAAAGAANRAADGAADGAAQAQP